MNKIFFVRNPMPRIVLPVLLAAAPFARALDPATPIDGYRHERFSEVDGAPDMRERAALIGARLECLDAEDGGARIVLTIPAAVAYGEARRAT